MNGQNVTFEVDGKSANGYLSLPAQPDAPGVIVLHAWWGLNQIFKSLCDRLASEGFVAFAPDLNEGRVAKTIEEAKQMMPDNEEEQRHPIVAAAPDFLRSRPEVRQGPLSVIGFSMGAAWSLVLASERPEDIGKVVLFYGNYEGMDVSNIRADVLGHFAETDEWEPMEGIRATEAAMQTVGLQTMFHIYPNMSHWFFEEDRPEFDPQAAEVAWKRTLEFLRK
ncbi:MAG TPA: dienelactone hydrolase family protein [Anaerolineales bacterium]|nr:dienelactone hydrolase family protein [Anaerolineales bacterium]